MKLLELVDLDGAVLSARAVRRPAGLLFVEATVKDIIARVREGGVGAVTALSMELDGADVSSGLEMAAAERESAWEGVEEGLKDAMRKTAGRIDAFARRAAGDAWMFEQARGVEAGQVFRPFDCAGIYAPGGRFAYPSTVLMTGIPAAAVGVRQIVFCIPPARDGKVNALSLAATTLVEGARVFRVGGAQAIAAMAYGAGDIPACGIVAGPGNVYVTEAKKQVSGDVTIDVLAGPSEVAVYVDSGFLAGFAAADLLSQLEHDPLAVAVCVSESREVLEAVEGAAAAMALSAGAPELDVSRITFALSACRDVTYGFLNSLAPEHLELLCDGAREMLEGIDSAGCVFLGPYSGVALGDYIAGPSHVLPTGGGAHARGGLSARDFQRAINVVNYDREGLMGDEPEVTAMARAEGLEMHARSVEERLKEQRTD